MKKPHRRQQERRTRTEGRRGRWRGPPKGRAPPAPRSTRATSSRSRRTSSASTTPRRPTCATGRQVDLPPFLEPPIRRNLTDAPSPSSSSTLPLSDSIECPRLWRGEISQSSRVLRQLWRRQRVLQGLCPQQDAQSGEKVSWQDPALPFAPSPRC